MDVNPTLKTVFANKQTESVYNQHGEAAATVGKIWYMPGEYKDDFKNTAFASYKGMPDVDTPIAEFVTKREQKTGLGSLDVKFMDSWEDKQYEWLSLIEKFGSAKEAYRQLDTPSVAAIVNKTTVDNTKALNILDKVLGLQERQFMLQEVVTRVAAPQLVFTVDRFTEGTVQGKVPELKEPKLVSHSESRVTKVLYKNIGHIAISEEAKLMGIHDTMRLRQDKTIKDMARLLNAQIATELDAFGSTGTAGADWGAKSGTPPDSSFDPRDDINAAMVAIQSNGFNVDYIVGHDRVINDLVGNKFIEGRGNEGGRIDASSSRILVPGLPQIIKDVALPNTKAFFGNKEAVWLGEGPTVVAAYNEEVIGYEGWLTKQWRLPYGAESEAFDERTGVSA